MEETRLDQWCIVELFGHSKIAGRCTEQNIAGVNMLRVDVPETNMRPAFTKYYGGTAIYAINPVDEETARLVAERLNALPVDVLYAAEVVKKQAEVLSKGIEAPQAGFDPEAPQPGFDIRDYDNDDYEGLFNG